MHNTVFIVSVLASVACASIIERQDPVTVTNTVTVTSCPAAVSDCAASTKYITVPCATKQSASHARGSATPVPAPPAAAAGSAHFTAAAESALHSAGAVSPASSTHLAAAGSAPLAAGAAPALSGSEQAATASSTPPATAGSASPPASGLAPPPDGGSAHPAGAAPSPSGSEQAPAASAPAPPAATGSPTAAGPVNGSSSTISTFVGNESEGCTAHGGCGTELPIATLRSTSTSIATLAVSKSSAAVSSAGSASATPSCPPGGCDPPQVSRASTNSVSLAAGVAVIVATLSFF
ncbi:hypothetical protein ARSEF1564_007032 [Beauveria bassiana]